MSTVKKRKITVLTQKGKPTFFVEPSYGAKKISEEVKKRFETQANGAPHNWRGDKVTREREGQEAGQTA